MKNLTIKNATMRFVVLMALCFCASIIDSILYGTLVDPMYQSELNAFVIKNAFVMIIGIAIIGILRKKEVI